MVSPSGFIYVLEGIGAVATNQKRRAAHRATRRFSPFLIAGLLAIAAVSVGSTVLFIQSKPAVEAVAQREEEVSAVPTFDCQKFFNWSISEQELFLKTEIGFDYESKLNWLSLGGLRTATASFNCDSQPVDVRVTQIARLGIWQIKNIARQN